MCGSGSLQAWGRDEDGQVGNDASADVSKPTPVPVATLTNVLGVAAGANHSLAIKNDSTLWAWGDDINGQLGNDNFPLDQTTPVQVATLTRIIAADGGQAHSLALKKDGIVWSFGQDSYGQLGDNAALANKFTPVQVATITGVSAIAAGIYHSLAVKSDGTVWSWGWDGAGQLGDDVALVNKATPVQVATVTNIVAVAAGYWHSIALKNDGTVWAWGNDTYGQLGDDAAFVSKYTPVQVAGLTGIISIKAGGYHSLALKNDGTVWSWGDDTYGHIGDDVAQTNKPTPVQVPTISNIIAIADGFGHSLALKSDGSLWSWGWDSYGQLGDNASYTNNYTPVQVGSACFSSCSK